MKNNPKINYESGQTILLAVLLSVTIATLILLGLSIPVADQIRGSSDYLSSRQVLVNSETASEEILYRLNNNKNVPAVLGFSVLGNTSALISDLDLTTKQVVSSSDNGSFVRKTITALISPNRTVAFNYGVWTGAGGVRMENSSVVNGNVFSLGGKVSTGSSQINGVYSSATSSVNMPISDADITNYKNQASTGVIINGNKTYSSVATSTVGSLKIVGNLTITNSSVLTLNGPLYVTGNLTMSNSSVLRLNSTYGVKSETIVVDGRIDIGNSSYLGGSGHNSSNIILITQNTSGCSNLNCTNVNPPAVKLENSAYVGAVILAPYGAVYLTNSASTKGVYANYLYMRNSASITFDNTLINMNFNSSTSTRWSLENLREI